MSIKPYSFQQYISKKITASSEVIDQTYKALEEGLLPDYIVDYKKEISQNLKYFEVCLLNQKRVEWKLLVSKKEKLLADLNRAENLSESLEKKILSCESLGGFRSIYKEYNKTTLSKAHQAKKAGLGKFAEWILSQAQASEVLDQTLEQEAKKFINSEAALVSVGDVLSAAQQIIVENILNDKTFNTWVYQAVEEASVSIQAGKKEVPVKHKAWVGYTKPCSIFFKPNMYAKYLELRKLWNKGFIKLNIDLNQALLQEQIYKQLSPLDNIKLRGFLYNTVQLALNQRLLPRYMQEKHRDFEEKAVKSESYKFLKSLDSILMAKPLGFNKPSMGIWPLKEGCYFAVVNGAGEYISSTHLSFKEEDQPAAKSLLQNILKDISLEYIALPTQEDSFFVKEQLTKLFSEAQRPKFIWTQNLGVSLYSEELALKDFKDLQFDQARAIFLARQLQSPFTELARLNLSTLSLTDTQHLLPKQELQEKITSVISRAIYTYGLNLNVCSASVLEYLPSFTPELSEALIQFRDQEQGFKEVSDLKKIPNFTSELFEEVGGSFILLSSKNPLDSTRIHPNQYARVRDMARELSCPTKNLFGQGAIALKDLAKKWKELLGNYSYDFLYNELKNCCVKESQNIDIQKPYVEQITLNVLKLEDIKEGLILDVWAKRLTSFGVFADFGLPQQGLILLSVLKKNKQVVYPGMWLRVKVENVNLTTKKFVFTLDYIYSDFKKPSALAHKYIKPNAPNKAFLTNKKIQFGKGKSNFKINKDSEKNKSFAKTKAVFNNPFAGLESMSGLLKEKK